MAARLELRWGAGDRLTITGSGFRPQERIAMTVVVRSSGSNVHTGPGTVIQSSQSVSQSTTTIAADAEGRFVFQSTIVAPAGAEITVAAAGSQGTRAEERTIVSQRSRA